MKTSAVRDYPSQIQTEIPVERANLPERAPVLIACIHCLENGFPTGELFSAYHKEPISFVGLSDMILKKDEIYTYLDFPQATREDRTFAQQAPKKYDRLAPYQPRYYQRYRHNDLTRAKLTLVAHTRFRQNGSWQGTLHSPQLNQSVCYVSALQFLKLAQEAVDTVFAKEAAPEIPDHGLKQQ